MFLLQGEHINNNNNNNENSLQFVYVFHSCCRVCGGILCGIHLVFFFIGRRRRCMLGVCERAAQADLFCVCVVIILYIDFDLSGNYRANCIYRVLSVSVSRDKIKEKGGKHKNLISKKQKNGIRN